MDTEPTVTPMNDGTSASAASPWAQHVQHEEFGLFIWPENDRRRYWEVRIGSKVLASGIASRTGGRGSVFRTALQAASAAATDLSRGSGS